MCSFFFFFNDTATTEIYTLSLHDALPIYGCPVGVIVQRCIGMRSHMGRQRDGADIDRSEEHTSELQSRLHLVCRLLLEKKKKNPLSTNISISECRVILPRVERSTHTMHLF